MGPAVIAIIVMWADVRSLTATRPALQAEVEASKAFRLQSIELFTKTDGYELENKLKTWVETRVPTNAQFQYLTQRITDMQQSINELKQLIKEDKENK